MSKMLKEPKKEKPANTLNKKSIKDSESKTKDIVKTSENKTTKKPQVSQNSNPFVDRYLEFYDDIKIPSRRYDW